MHARTGVAFIGLPAGPPPVPLVFERSAMIHLTSKVLICLLLIEGVAYAEEARRVPTVERIEAVVGTRADGEPF